MLKSLRRLWWNGVKRISREQQSQGRKLVRSLLSASRIRPIAQAKRKAKPAPRAKAKTSLVRASSAQAKRVVASATRQPDGIWSRSSYSSSPVDGVVPPRRMDYLLFVPDGVKKSSMPLVVMLHGCDQSASQFAQGTRMNLLAGKKKFAVLYPQQSVRANSQRCWNWYDKATQDGGGDVKMIAGIIQKVIRTNPIDQTRIYIGGMSAGAAMANIVALHYPRLIAAVGLHSGAVFGAAHSPLGAFLVMQNGASHGDAGTAHRTKLKSGNRPAMPAILIHGQQDYVVRSVNMAQAAQQFRIWNRLSGDSDAPVISDHPRVIGGMRSRNAYQLLDYYDDDKLMVRVCEISKLGHAWSGGDCTVRFNDCEGPDASLLMWNFFAQHRRLMPSFAKSSNEPGLHDLGQDRIAQHHDA